MWKKNDRIRLTITDMGVNGEGIGKNGMTFFVKNAVIGDEVLAVVTAVKKGYGYAKVLEILKASPDRVRPACPLAERCGGCQVMQLSYEAQLRFKENKVLNDLERIGGQTGLRAEGAGGKSTDEDKTGGKFEPIIGMDEEPTNDIPGEPEAGTRLFQPLHFRNKMQFPVGWDREGHIVTGFYAGRTHYIIAAADCPVSPEVNRTILEGVRTFLKEHRISAYKEETGEGLIRHVLIRNGFHTGQIMVCLVINGDRLEEEKGSFRKNTAKSPDLEKELADHLTGIPLPKPWVIRSICLNINKEKTNVILGRDVRCLYGEPYIEEQITGIRDGMDPLTFRIGPLSFFQTNTVQTARLYETALSFAGLTGKETVWDLYCGTGTISLYLARKAAFVHGVEIVPEAIRDARENAQRNHISNVRFYCGRSEELFPLYAGQQQEKPDVVVLDPPRKGCDPALLEAIRRTGPEKIVYVSCDPATLARDVKILCAPATEQDCQDSSEAGQESCYELKKVRPVDMFPHTMHVETVCCLSRQ